MDLSADQVLSAEAAPIQSQREQFQFKGSATEYFRIWIVNLSLTIVTLGIYSAWAKVRKNRYIYGNLELAGSHFDYLAKPMVILRGRLIALVLLAAYLVSQAFFPPLSVIFFLVLGIGTPWLIVRSRMFNMRYTSYRNIRFSFNRAYGDAYNVIFGYGALSIITLGLAVPYAHFQRNRMIVDNTNFGNLGFGLNKIGKKFYAAYSLGALLGICIIAPLGIFAFNTGLAAQAEAETSSALNVAWQFLLIGLLYYVVLQFIKAYVLRATTNNTWIGKQEDDVVAHKLGCDWSLSGMLGIYLTNIIAIALSLGLLIPWAQMRILRYQLNHTWVDLSGSLDDVVAGQIDAVSSLGEEIGDVFDVDIGL
jgi:uncharacterized membrane protein YjgN (DUF898 family)